jgi:hypothetical protein
VTKQTTLTNIFFIPRSPSLLILAMTVPRLSAIYFQRFWEDWLSMHPK